MVRRNKAKRNRRNGSNRTRKGNGRDVIVSFSSGGAIGSTAFSGNQRKLLDNVGSPFFEDTEGTFGFGTFHLRLDNYFNSSIFQAYDYFRVHSCETHIRWGSCPDTGPIMGDAYYYIDKDSLVEPTYSQLANRRELKHLAFTNDKLVHKIVWKPWLVLQQDKAVNYIQPRERWLNTDLHKEFRFGNLNLLFTTPNATTQYATGYAGAIIRHVVTIEVRGQKTVQAEPQG